jgi:hypothetical protein
MLSAADPEEGPQSGGQNEDRRAEMGNPARKEDGRCCALKVGGGELHGTAGDKVTNVIDRH